MNELSRSKEILLKRAVSLSHSLRVYAFAERTNANECTFLAYIPGMENSPNKTKIIKCNYSPTSAFHSRMTLWNPHGNRFMLGLRFRKMSTQSSHLTCESLGSINAMFRSTNSECGSQIKSLIYVSRFLGTIFTHLAHSTYYSNLWYLLWKE